MKTLGLILILVGIAMTVFTGFSIVSEKKVANIGPIEINKNESTPIYWKPVVGILIMVSGIILIVTPKGKAKG